ncbi:MAG: hypothetical protein ACLPKT_19910 [Methylocella sp.]
MKFDIIHFKSPNSLFQIIQRICDFIFVILDEVFCVIAKIVQGFDGGPGSGLKPRRPNRILRLTFNPNGMRDVIAQRGKRVKDLEVALDLVNLIERDRSVTEQVEQGIALFGKAEAAGQQLYGSRVRAAHGRHNLLHKNFMPGEPLYDFSEENQMLLGEAIRRPFAHAQNLSLGIDTCQSMQTLIGFTHSAKRITLAPISEYI